MRFRGCLTLIAACVLVSCRSRADDSNAVELYLQEIKPVLAERCLACHGALKQEGGLRLDTVSEMLAGGDSGPAIVPGHAVASLLHQRLTSSLPDERMPLEGEPLKADQIAKIASWLDQNAAAPADEQPDVDPRSHWAFQPVVRPPVPDDPTGWATGDVDRLVAAKYREHGLVPQTSVDDLTLVRRVYLDLVGMAPTSDEIAAIHFDDPEWYSALVEALLNDARYGERWARHWMDIWRYSDWWGLGDQLRNSQYHMWHWRDWIIQSLNSDLPYDEMVRQMLAADELNPTDPDKLRATGYLARNYYLFNRDRWLEETVEHVGKSLLGLTMNCAKCHDHKYDPFPQADFYKLRAFFEPYQVRLDMVPGQIDFKRNGLPRVFDDGSNKPTYLYFRGEESRPDRSSAIEPALPELLSFKPLQIAPVSLPTTAWQPGRQPWVVANYLKDRQQVWERSRQASLDLDARVLKLTGRLEHLKSEQKDMPASTGSAPQVVINDTFEQLDPAVWLPLGGQWLVGDNSIQQTADGPERSALRLQRPAPRNFDATLTYTLRGGSRWRSVGIEFDAHGGPVSDAQQPQGQLVYLSGVEGGAKLQAAQGRDGNWNYPADGAKSQTVQLNTKYALRIKVRDDLINAFVNEELVLAYRTPQPRYDGYLQFITFDAVAEFHDITVAVLDERAEMTDPAAHRTDDPQTVAACQQALDVARAELEVAVHAQAVAAKDVARVAALATYFDDPSQQNRSTVMAAQHELRIARAAHAVAVAQQKLTVSAARDRAAAEAELLKQQQALADLPAQAVDESGEIDILPGAQWSATRFVSSSADDPAVPFPATSTGRRTALADWITDRQNPLTARVAVNHIWNRHFGTPLVATVFDFGRKGSQPTNQQLLDWLAAEFMQSGWSMKHLHRLLVKSHVYRLSSSNAGCESNAEKDPENLLWWRRNGIRLESQAVRDSILRLSGQLEQQLYGPSVAVKDQADSRRRSVYFFHSNNDRNQFLTIFDEAAVKECYRRDQSVVPQQALAMANSQLVLQAADLLARKLSESATDDRDFVVHAFREVLTAHPTQAELDACLQAMQQWDAPSSRKNLIWALFNHNDFVTVR